MKKILYILFLLICGCTTTTENDSYNQKLAIWLGKPQEMLYKYWGEPDEQFIIDADTYEVEYSKVYKYPSFNREEVYARELSDEIMDIGPEYGQSQEAAIYYCKTNFTIQDGVVVDYGFNGDNCI